VSRPRIPWAWYDRPAIVLLGLAQAAAIGASLLVVWRVVDALQSAGDSTRLLYAVAALAGVVAVHALLQYLEFTVTEIIGFQIVRRLRMSIYRHMSGMIPRQIQHRSRGSLILRLTGDLTMLRTWISRGIGRGVIGAMIVLAAGGALVWLSPVLAAIVGAVFLVGGLLSYLQGRAIGRATRRVRRRRSLVTSNIDEQVHALAVVQIFGRIAGEGARLGRQNDALTRALVIEARVRGRLRMLSALTGWAAMVAVLAAAGLLPDARTSIGVIAAALTAVRYISSGANSLALAHEYWRRGQVSWRKIVDFLNSSSQELSAPHQLRLGSRPGDIALTGVSVPGALSNVSGVIGASRRVAILGPGGSGKSTLLSVIAGLTEPEAGHVSFGGRPASEYTRLSVFRAFGMMSPDLPLVRGSLRRNISYRPSRSPEADLAWTLATTGLDRLVASLPDGLDTWVTEGGTNLSAGQREHIAFGRALFGNPPVLLLDEPCARLDPAARRTVREAIRRHRGAVVIATLDARDAELADEVWFMEAGRLVRKMSGDDFREQCRERRLGVRLEGRAERRPAPC